MRKLIALLIAFLSLPSFSNIDTRFQEAPTFMTKSNMIRFQYLSHEGSECTAGVSTKLISRVPYYVYAPATSATQLSTGKYSAVIFLHGLSEQGASILNMCYNRDDTYYANIATNLVKVEYAAGGPGAAILNGQFTPNEKMVVIIPQSMKKGGFSADVIRRVMEDTTLQLAAKGIELDADRIYITGLSMGGGSLMKYLASNPTHFAAALPIEPAGGIDACLLRDNHIAFWGFAGGATGNMGSSNLKNIIYSNDSCPDTTIEYKNPSYTCVYEGKSCTILSAPNPTQLRATFMPTDGHSGWRSVYNGTHSALPTTEKNVYNWMLSQRNSFQGKPLFPLMYTNGITSSSAASSKATTSSVASSSSSSSTATKSSSLSSSSVTSNSIGSSQSSSSATVGVPSTIPLSPSMILSGAPANAFALVDEQTSSAPTTYWFPGWQATYPIEAIIDLGREYTITEVTLYDANGVGKVEVSDGDLSHLQTPIVSDPLTSYLKFISQSINVTTRYIRVKKFDSAAMSEIKLKGY